MNVGLAIPKVFAAGDSGVASLDGDQAYVGDLVAKYDLTGAQERSLRLVMQNWREEEYAVFRSTEAAQLPPAILSRLLAVRSRTEQRIRVLLDPEQRARYDRESRPPTDR